MNKFVWVIDDHQLFNAGLSRLLVGLSGVDEVLSFADPQEALALDDQSVAPVLMVIDYFIPGFKAGDWLPKLCERYPDTPKAVVSSSISSLDRKRCLELGAVAYFEKHLEPDAVLLGLQEVLQDSYQQKNEDTSIAERFAEDKLTQRQTEILICLARGSSLKVIAQQLDISPETVKTHLSKIYQSLNISSKDEAIIWAREHGLV